jgi:hypothetical protein
MPLSRTSASASASMNTSRTSNISKQRREETMVASSNHNSSMMRSLLSLLLVPLVLASTASTTATAPVIAKTRTTGPGNYPVGPQLHERQRHLRYGLKERSSSSEEKSEESEQERSLQTDVNGERITNFSDDGAEPKERIELDTFQIVMTPSPYELDISGQDEFHRLCERVLFDYITNELFKNALVYSDVELQYVLLGDMQSQHTPGNDNVRHLQDTTTTETDATIGGSTTLTLSSGVASFLGAGLVPSTEQVNIWVQEAIDTTLVQYLREQGTDFYYVGEGTFVPNATPVSQPEESSAVIADNNQIGMLVGVAVACVVAVALLGMFVARRHFGLLGGSGASGRRMFDQELDSVNDSDTSRKGGDSDTVNESYETDGGSPVRKGPSSPGFGGAVAGFERKEQLDLMQQETFEQEQVYDADAGSVSDFTVKTEFGDTTALKTINAKQIMAVVPAMINSESFERERPVNIRKDMLTSAWSGRANAKRTSHNESVLQPSHFTASHERRVRRQEQDFDPDPSWNPEDDSVDVVGSNASPFVFEQAHESPSVGEEIYLMPPSQTRARTQSPVPEIL